MVGLDRGPAAVGDPSLAEPAFPLQLLAFAVAAVDQIACQVPLQACQIPGLAYLTEAW